MCDRHSTVPLSASNSLQLPSIWSRCSWWATCGAVIAFILPGSLGLSMAGWHLGSAAGAGGFLLILSGHLLVATGGTNAVLH